MLPPAPRLSPAQRARRRFGVITTAPGFLVLYGLLLVPAAASVWYSLSSNALGVQRSQFVGLDNYLTVLRADAFWHSLTITVIFAAVFVLLSTLIGLGMAVVLNRAFPGQRFLAALLIIPWATPWVVVGIIWNRFASDEAGVSIQHALTVTGLIEPHSSLLAHPVGAMVLVIVAASWRQSCFAAMLFLSGLKTVAPSVIEAAQMDGAGPVRTFWHVILPWIRPVTVTVLLINVIYGFLQFDVVYAMTHGGPGNATQILSILIYQTLFTKTLMGTGSALSVLLGVVALCFGMLVVVSTGRSRNDEGAR